MARIVRNEELDPDKIADLSEDDVDWIYNALDTCVTHEVYLGQLSSIDEVASATSKFSHTLMAPVFEMSLRGTKIDLRARDAALEEYRAMHTKIAADLTDIVEQGVGFAPFNYRSNHQLKKLFYQIMGYKPYKARNSAGQYAPTVNREALERLRQHWFALPLCNMLLKLRELDKKITFLETTLDEDNRMRSSYNIAGTNTGRLSSSESDFGTGTNNQNIERLLRTMFVADKGMKFCNIDLEQADARNVGAIIWNLFIESHGEEYAGAYLDACESGDLHSTVCRMAWRNLPWPEDRSGWRAIADQPGYRELSYRDLAKRLGHGTNYYGTPRTMALHAKVEVKMIDTFQARYFAAFPAIGNHGHIPGDNWHTRVRQELIDTGCLITPHFNRRRYFFGRPEDDTTLREAIAYCPQSMTADEIDTGVINLYRHLPEIQLLIQVHDSILFQYPEHLEATIIPRALELLTIKFDLKKGRQFFVPAEAKVGWNWADADTKKNVNTEAGLIKWKGPGSNTRKRPVILPYRPVSGIARVLNAKI